MNPYKLTKQVAKSTLKSESTGINKVHFISVTTDDDGLEFNLLKLKPIENELYIYHDPIGKVYNLIRQRRGVIFQLNVVKDVGYNLSINNEDMLVNVGRFSANKDTADLERSAFTDSLFILTYDPEYVNDPSGELTNFMEDFISIVQDLTFHTTDEAATDLYNQLYIYFA